MTYKITIAEITEVEEMNSYSKEMETREKLQEIYSQRIDRDKFDLMDVIEAFNKKA